MHDWSVRLRHPVGSERSVKMPRPRQRIRLQDGLWLDLNKLLREGLGPPGGILWPAEIRWTSTHSGEIAKGWIKISKESDNSDSVKIVIGKPDLCSFEFFVCSANRAA